eukprot:gb/GFBE01073842.1/.p1 GENE.gb/GFBE01073842.1/~~gb/GFBE01073842.1/.p1  ORF type:complete len:254 (+),score=42.59 gb/GFBE01073842.1/:1-762(+)
MQVGEASIRELKHPHRDRLLIMGNTQASDQNQTLVEQESQEMQVMPLEVSMEPAEQEAEESSPPWRKFAAKVLVSVSVFLLLTVLLEVFAKDEVASVSRRLMDTIGLPGLFLCVLAADGLPQPFTYVPLIFFAVKAGIAKPVVFLVCAAASYTAALSGYGIGMGLRQLECGQAFFRWLVDLQPWLPDLMQRRGAVGVALAALMPIPLALATWTAGSFRVNFLHFLLAGTFRMPKILVFVLLSGAGGTTRGEIS